MLMQIQIEITKLQRMFAKEYQHIFISLFFSVYRNLSGNDLRNLLLCKSNPLDLHFQVSSSVKLPEAGVVACRLGSLSHVTAPLKMRIYLYSKVVLAGRLTVTKIFIRWIREMRYFSV